jgi:D-galactarolactone cycloisomerase
MNRRQFLHTTAAAATTALAFSRADADDEGLTRLAGHKLQGIELKRVPLPWPREVGKNSKLDRHGKGPTLTVCVLKTDQGAVGWGDFPARHEMAAELSQKLAGKPISDLIDPVSGILNRDWRPLDIALHDLAGVILGQPVWKMLGAKEPHLYPIYSGMVYFDDLDPADKPAGIDQVLKNCAADREMGYRQLKVKVGRGTKWMPGDTGLKRDIEVMHAIAKAFPDCQLLIDANDAWNVETTISFLKGIEGIPLVWIEEPFVESDRAWRKLHQWIQDTPYKNTWLADGEQYNDFPMLDKLEADGILDVRLTDIVGHGFTPWRGWMPRLVKTGTLASPHCWGSGLSTVYAAHLVGGLGNGSTVEGVSCTHEHVDFGENVIRDGKLQLSTKPGFGLTLR